MRDLGPEATTGTRPRDSSSLVREQCEELTYLQVEGHTLVYLLGLVAQLLDASC